MLTFLQMAEYTVLDSEPCGGFGGGGGGGGGGTSVSGSVGGAGAPSHNSPFILADVELAKSADLGKNDTQLTVRTHLGALLKAGDVALG